MNLIVKKKKCINYFKINYFIKNYYYIIYNNMDNIFVINLEEREDKMKHINKTFGNYFNINRVNAVKDDEGWKGCLKSHLNCIKCAKDNNLKYIIVMEDDCVPMCENWFERFKNIKKNIFDIKDDWDIFLGGSVKTSIKKINKYNFNDDIYNIAMAHSAYMIVYNHTCYDFFLNSNHDLPIDVMWHKKIKCIMGLPFLFSIISSMSDIANIYVNHKNRIIENQNKLIQHIKNNNIN